MQIRRKVNTQNRPEQNLLKKWILSILPWIAGILILPYLFLFLGQLYAEEFHSLPMRIWTTLVLIQASMVLAILFISALVSLQNVSQQLRHLSEILELQMDQPDGNHLEGDEWITIEKNEDSIGRTARGMKRWMMQTKSLNRQEMESMCHEYHADDILQVDWNSNRPWFANNGKSIDSLTIF